jgi:hypothetical protein
VTPTSVIQVKAFIDMEFDFESPSVYMGKLLKGESVTRGTFLLVKNPEEARITEITTSSPHVVAQRVEFTDPQKGEEGFSRWKIDVTVNPGLPVGRIDETVTVHTNLEKMPTAILKVSGILAGDVEVAPEWLTFVITSDQPATRDLVKKAFVSSNQKEIPLQVLSVTDPQNNLDLQYAPVIEGQKYEITATLKQSTISDGTTLSGNIVITTNLPEQKELLLRYSAVRKSGQVKGNPALADTGDTSMAVKKGIPPLEEGGPGMFEAQGEDPFAAAAAAEKPAPPKPAAAAEGSEKTEETDKPKQLQQGGGTKTTGEGEKKDEEIVKHHE